MSRQRGGDGSDSIYDDRVSTKKQITGVQV
jgi:hypothetical protein